MFGLSNTVLRSALDVRKGNIHVDSGEGVYFTKDITTHSSLIFNDGDSDAVSIFTRSDFTTPLFALSSTGDAVINGFPTYGHDLTVIDNIDNEPIITIEGSSGVTAGIILEVDDGDYDIAIDSQGDFKVHDDGVVVMSAVSDGYMGIFDPTPNQSVSIAKSTAASAQPSSACIFQIRHSSISANHL